MPAENESRKRNEPRASRPSMLNYGILDADKGRGLLPWSWAQERLEKSHNYLLSTTRPDGAPHLMPVWGLWHEDVFYFSTGRQSRKSRNLATNPKCVVCNDILNEVVIVEGIAEEVTQTAELGPLAEAYQAKYPPWKLDPSLGPIYAVRPRVAFAFLESDFTGASTRWQFDDL